MKKFIFAVILGLITSSCQKADNTIIDTSQPINATQLTFVGKDSVDIANYHATIPPSFVISDSFVVTLSSVNGFSYLNVKVENDSGIALAQESFSSLKGDSIGGNFSFSPSSVYVGDLNYTFTPYNNDGTPGNYSSKMVHLYNSASNPPVIDSVSAPDSIKSANVSLILYATVQDAYGISDIQEVYFNVTKPDGTPSTGNPFTMFNDGGASGAGGDADQIAGDNIFTLGINLSASNVLGTYIFTFYAVNRSGVKSAPFSHNIRIY